jgi:outer membrane protein insertion porin family
LIRFLVIFFLILTSNCFSQIKKVNITGNLKVSSNTIETLIDKKIVNIDSAYINNLTKIIYDTDLFSDVKINYNQEVLSISVVENPIIIFFYINGIKDQDLDQANKIITLKENNIFSSSKLKKDIENLKEYFKSLGYYLVEINPEVRIIENNQVNLIISIEKKELVKIKNIYFIGDKYFSSSKLLEVVASEEDGWWKLFSSTALSEQKVEYDKQLLKDFYKSKGFYDVQVESVFANIDSKSTVSLTFAINSGKKYKFGDIDLKVNSSIYKESDALEIKNISNKFLAGALYSPNLLNKINKEITTYLISKKYNNFQINIKENKKINDIIDIRVELNEEPKVLVNRINIQGNTITEEKVIRNNLILTEGDYLSLSKIKKSIDSIKSKQLFSKIDYKIEDSEKDNSKNFNLFVKEQPTGNISAGVGYGTNGGLFEGSINERNFLGQGINLNFTGRFSTEKVTGVFSYNDPDFKGSNKEFNYSLYSEVDDYVNSGYQNKKVGTKLGTKYEIYDDLYFRPNFSLGYEKLDTDSTASTLLKTREGKFTTTSLGYNFSSDLRDSKFNPTSGSIIFFDQDVAFLFSDIPTVQTVIGGVFYKELINENFVGSAKIKFGNVVAFDSKNVKLSDRFFTGTSDLRGFDHRGIGPIDGGDHVGGNNLAIIGLKTTFPNPIPDVLRPTSYIFYDIANIWGVDYSNSISDSSKIRSSIGIGIDITSPVGPLTFSYGVPISKLSTDKEQRFLFNLGSSF